MGSTTSPRNTVQPGPVYTPSTPVAQILESIVNDGNARNTSSNSTRSLDSGNNKTPKAEGFNSFPTYPPVIATIAEPFSPPVAAPFFSFPIPAQNGASPIVRTPSFLHSSSGGSLRYTSLPYLASDTTHFPVVHDADTGSAMPIAHEATSRQTPPSVHASTGLINGMHDVTYRHEHEHGHEREHSNFEYGVDHGAPKHGQAASFSLKEHAPSRSQSQSHTKSTTLKSKSSKMTSGNGMHERIKEELRRAREGTSYSSHSRSLSHSHSHSEADSAATPTADDHAHRHRSRHHKHSSSSSSSLSAMLVLATERLSRETKRADAAEREGREVLALFKTLHAAKGKIEAEFLRVKEELGLYKIQLDIAQKEIYRAQEIVDRVDRQRANAEDEIQRLTSKLRKLQEERAVAHALEEGRRLGYEEGLRQGRVAMQQYEHRNGSDDGGDNHEEDRNSGVTRFTYPPDDVRSMDSSLRSTGRERGRHREQPPLASASKHGPSAKRRRDPLPPAPAPTPAPTGPPPDTAPFAATLPIPTITTPMPVQVPSSQPPVPKPMPPHQPPEQIRVHLHPSDPNAPIHPVPWHNAPRSPNVSHRDIVLPPDNYIPVMDANSVISLPPPHELSVMVAPEAPDPARSIRNGRDGASVLTRANPTAPTGASSIGGQRTRPPSAFRVVNQDPTERPRRASRPPISLRQQPRTDRDEASTYQSELDALSPPRDYREYVPGSFYGRPNKAGNGPAEGSSKRPDSAEMVAEQWRNANPQYISMKSPRPQTPGPRQPEPSPSAGPPLSPYGKPASLTGGTAPPIRTPRQPRDIVLPMPDMPTHRPPSRNQQEAPYAPSSNYLAAPPSTYGRPNLTTEISNVTIPGIDIQTPSTRTPTSTRSDFTHLSANPGYLTPESANRLVPLPAPQETHAGDTSLGLTFSPAPSTRSFGAERLRGGAGTESEYDNRERIDMTLPTNELPAGFVPLSPLNIGK
ncbi:hypothetical protein D9619_013506 [Psilocybe cf. subviscida]|uniref:Uncharacterized protein n=1 Tax=Psilocybe cf. subviscida TaxID=2480587 RepID=A0A8H5BIR0_9AGAR|nr:hypothetical protein D9619_013506 [Psilocybe cf. subviscida]